MTDKVIVNEHDDQNNLNSLGNRFVAVRLCMRSYIAECP